MLFNVNANVSLCTYFACFSRDSPCFHKPCTCDWTNSVIFFSSVSLPSLWCNCCDCAHRCKCWDTSSLLLCMVFAFVSSSLFLWMDLTSTTLLLLPFPLHCQLVDPDLQRTPFHLLHQHLLRQLLFLLDCCCFCSLTKVLGLPLHRLSNVLACAGEHRSTTSPCTAWLLSCNPSAAIQRPRCHTKRTLHTTIQAKNTKLDVSKINQWQFCASVSGLSKVQANNINVNFVRWQWIATQMPGLWFLRVVDWSSNANEKCHTPRSTQKAHKNVRTERASSSGARAVAVAGQWKERRSISSAENSPSQQPCFQPQLNTYC